MSLCMSQCCCLLALNLDLSLRFEGLGLRFEHLRLRCEHLRLRFEDLRLRFEGLSLRYEKLSLMFGHLSLRFEDLRLRFEHLSLRFEDLGLRFEDLSLRLTGWRGLRCISEVDLATLFIILKTISDSHIWFLDQSSDLALRISNFVLRHPHLTLRISNLILQISNIWSSDPQIWSSDSQIWHSDCHCSKSPVIILYMENSTCSFELSEANWSHNNLWIWVWVLRLSNILGMKGYIYIKKEHLLSLILTKHGVNQEMGSLLFTSQQGRGSPPPSHILALAATSTRRSTSNPNRAEPWGPGPKSQLGVQGCLLKRCLRQTPCLLPIP